MTFREMRFPTVWITLAFCVVLCWLDGARAGPMSRRGLQAFDAADGLTDQQREPPSDFMRGPRQQRYPAEEVSDEDDDATLEDDDEEYDRRSLQRSTREIAQRPVADVEDESAIPAESVAPATVVDKRPSVLELLSSALDKAIEATSKIPTQQVASDAAGVFHILGQVFSEAIDKVIGGDDGPEEATEVGETAGEVATEASDDKGPEDPPAPAPDTEPMKPDPDQEPSQSDKEIVNNL